MCRRVASPRLGDSVASCDAPYVDKFMASQETMRGGMPCDGPEVAAADRSVRSYFEDM
jgi:hypothetical protein